MISKYVFIVTATIIITGCSVANVKQKIKNILPEASTQNLILEKINNNAPTLALAEIIKYEWEYIRFIRPYQTKKIYGQTFNQKDDGVCQWIILGKEETTKEDTVLESFSIERNSLDCIDLPDKTFSKSDAIFLIRDGKLTERKKFKR